MLPCRQTNDQHAFALVLFSFGAISSFVAHGTRENLGGGVCERNSEANLLLFVPCFLRDVETAVKLNSFQRGKITGRMLS